MTITQEELKKFLHYNPETGIFVWLIKPAKSIRIGDVAGTVHIDKGGKNYIRIRLNHKRYRAHRLSWLYMTGEFPDNDIDHINGDGIDNRWSNLRDVTATENKKNTRIQSNNTSGICGVRLDTRSEKWIAVIKVNYNKKHLGCFDNIFEAACARKNAEVIYGFHKNHGSDRPL